jgi:hypothetical protein
MAKKKKVDVIDKAAVIKILSDRLAVNREWLETALEEEQYYMASESKSHIRILELVLADIQRLPTNTRLTG